VHQVEDQPRLYYDARSTNHQDNTLISTRNCVILILNKNKLNVSRSLLKQLSTDTAANLASASRMVHLLKSNISVKVTKACTLFLI
jgi:hypothetical protein